MFRITVLSSIVAVFFLIFIGSLVRTTGAGMGCPDWPKCFGQYVPPTSVSELNPNYLDEFKEVRIKKNQRLELLFVALGIEKVLYDKQKNHNTYEEIHFNALNTWIEYVNRLVGLIVGFLVLGVFLGCLRYIKTQTSIFLLALFSLILLLIEAFMGSVVVSTNLFPELISLHMLLAVLLVFCLLKIYFDLFLKKEKNPTPKSIGLANAHKVLKFLSIGVIIITFIQMYLGINIREQVDFWHNTARLESGIIEKLDKSFYIHRSFSLLVLGANMYMVFKLQQEGLNNWASKTLLPFTFLCVFTGITLAYFDLTKYSQPFHLFFATLLIGMQYLNFLYVKFAVSNR